MLRLLNWVLAWFNLIAVPLNPGFVVAEEGPNMVPAPEPEPEAPANLSPWPEVRPMTVTPIDQPRPRVMRRSVGPIRAQTVRSFGAKRM